MTNLGPYIGAWMVLAVVVLALPLYRKFVSVHADNYLHVSEGESRLIPNQISVNQKIDRIDRWGEILTVLTQVAGLVLACVYFLSGLVKFSRLVISHILSR
jgi:hypothetical protein